MTDEELLGYLRRSSVGYTKPLRIAADRIEALVKELATSNEVGRAFEEDAGQQRARAERLEAALREIASGKFSGQLLMSNPPKDPAADFARAALKGDDHE